MWGIKKIAEILIIIIVLFIILFMLMGYGTLLKENIMKLFGAEIESETTEEQNIKTKTAFENLKGQIETCQNYKDDNCLCVVDLKKFGDNYKINFSENEMKLINIKNIRDGLKNDEGLQMDHFNKKLNCYWDNQFIENKFTDMFFSGENPYLFKKVWGWTTITGRGRGYNFPYDFNILKKNNKLCWLTDQVKEDKIELIPECK